MAGRGYNTFHGFDTGPLPPGFSPAQPAGVPQYQTFPWPQQAWGWPAGQPSMMPQPMVMPTQMSYPGFQFPATTYPAMAPAVNPRFPGINLRNHTGGVGLPPGYDYAFPKEHTMIHVFTTKEKPWQALSPLWNSDASKHVKMVVPTNTTVKELMQNLGCTNEDPKKNMLYEVTEAGNGRWVKGLTISGDDKDRVKKAISEFGWDKSRTGNPGERPVVWLYATKD